MTKKIHKSKQTQFGGDFVLQGDQLSKIHDCFKNQISNGKINEEEFITTSRKLLLILHPDRGGDTELFQKRWNFNRKKR
jgi:hypothetical protein